jgi:hypothetical protein
MIFVERLKRKNGTGLGKQKDEVAPRVGSPRDIVDLGGLRNSQKRENISEDHTAFHCGQAEKAKPMRWKCMMVIRI